MEDLKHKQNGASVIFCDNKSVIALSKNPIQQERTKHVEIKHHFIRELVASNVMELLYINTEDQPADMFIKALTEAKFYKFHSMLGVEALS